MTRTLSLILVLLTVPVATQAQGFGVGAKGGLTFVNIVHQPTEDYGIESNAQTGLLGGAFVTFLDAKGFSVQADAVLAKREVDFGVSVQEFTSFDAPVVVRYRVLSRGDWTVRATGGFTSTFILSAEEKVVGNDPFDVKDAFESVIFSAVFGGQAEWKGRWLFEGRMMFGLTEVDSQPIPGFTSRLRGFEVTAGYRFW